jgi:hypothetical protein
MHTVAQPLCLWRGLRDARRRGPCSVALLDGAVRGAVSPSAARGPSTIYGEAALTYISAAPQRGSAMLGMGIFLLCPNIKAGPLPMTAKPGLT